MRKNSYRFALAIFAGLLLLGGSFFVAASGAQAATSAIQQRFPTTAAESTYQDKDYGSCQKWSMKGGLLGATLGYYTKCASGNSTRYCEYVFDEAGKASGVCDVVDANNQVIQRTDGGTAGDAGTVANVNPDTGEVTDMQVTGQVAEVAAVVGDAVATGFECVVSGPIDCIITATGSAILKISQLFLGMAGVLFNLVVVKTVFQFSTVIGNAPGLLIAWGIMRDVGNMLLLFGFIFMGLSTILGLNSYAVRNALPRLIIFAILMNFSLFAAEAVIDTSNALSSILYSQANSNNTCAGLNSTGATTAQGSTSFDSATADLETDCMLNDGIGGSIMSATGLSTMFAVRDGQALQSIAVYIGLSLFATIGAIVMLAASIMLITRTVVLTFVMMTSPIGFAGMAVPVLQGAARKWWSELIHQAFFAPILLVLILASLKISETFAGVGGNASLAQAFMQPNSSVMGIILVFFLVIGLLVGSLVMAKNFGAKGATFAINNAKKVVLGSYGGIAGVVGRRTVGAASAQGQKKYEAFMGRQSHAFQSRIMASGLDGLVGGTLKAGQEAKFGSTKSFKSDKEHHKAREAEFGVAKRKADIDIDLNNALAEAPSVDRDDKIAEILQRMSTKEIEELDTLKHSGENLDTLARNLSAEKFAALVKDGSTLSEEQKNGLRASRFKEVSDLISAEQAIVNDPNSTQAQKDAATKAIQTRVRKYSVKELENAPSDLLMDDNVARHLSNSQRDDLIKNNNISPAAVRKVKQFDPVERVNKEYTDNGAAAAAPLIASLKLNPKQTARLKDELLGKNEVIDLLTPKMLQAIEDRNEIDDVTARAIKARILAVGVNHPSHQYVTTIPRGMAYWS